MIQEELGETDGTEGAGGYRERIENSKMPDDVRKKALAEAKKLETGGSQNHESSVIRNYLDLLLDLPWVTEEKKNIDIAEARRVLESHHNGLEKVKERIVQHLAVMKLKQREAGLDPPLRRPARHRQDEPWQEHCGSSRAEVCPDQPGRCPGRGRDPGAPADVCRGPAREDHPGHPEGRHEEPGLHP